MFIQIAHKCHLEIADTVLIINWLRTHSYQNQIGQHIILNVIQLSLDEIISISQLFSVQNAKSDIHNWFMYLTFQERIRRVIKCTHIIYKFSFTWILAITLQIKTRYNQACFE